MDGDEDVGHGLRPARPVPTTGGRRKKQKLRLFRITPEIYFTSFRFASINVI
ncbi:hypothetical protein M8C21_015636 [Ambrosia artemisiifolia]|uniref:Uncharacterized protein n=1 Tax=Ambrosia artemisiifolia TaxID=4212 RepID=A0AAD5CU72_AMBAR|nr:hypothetical protein M8C21_015636 [Ambrosia artemisiifolia]